MRVLITGGAGYIGSTIASACLDAGHEVVIVDDFSVGRREFVEGRTAYEGDIADAALMDRVFTDQTIDVVVHCAAAIIVPESVARPLFYYENNVGKTLDLLASMDRHGVHRIVFSSSASLYGDPVDGQFAVTEESPVAPGSPYARTKLVMEMALSDVAHGSDLRAIALRYFNPIGAAQCTTTSMVWSVNTRSMSAASAMSPSYAVRPSTNSRRPTEKSSTMTTSWPESRQADAMVLPMYPAPPVMSTRTASDYPSATSRGAEPAHTQESQGNLKCR